MFRGVLWVGSPCVERLSHSGPQSSMLAAPRCLRCRQAGHRPMLLSRIYACSLALSRMWTRNRPIRECTRRYGRARTQSCSPAHHSA